MDNDLFKNLLNSISVNELCESKDEGSCRNYDKAKLDTSQMQPPVWAYVGDCVHNLYVRCHLVSKYHSNVNKLHKFSVSYVSAHSQSGTLHKIFDELSEHEQYIIKRGRNAKTGSVPKNADITEYKFATGFESLIGYLFLEGKIERLTEILKRSVDEAENLSTNVSVNKKKDENSHEPI